MKLKDLKNITNYTEKETEKPQYFNKEYLVILEDNNNVSIIFNEYKTKQIIPTSPKQLQNNKKEFVKFGYIKFYSKKIYMKDNAIILKDKLYLIKTEYLNEIIKTLNMAFNNDDIQYKIVIIADEVKHNRSALAKIEQYCEIIKLDDELFSNKIDYLKINI